MQLTSKYYSSSEWAKKYYSQWANGKVYPDRYRREQNGKQQNPRLLAMWAAMPMKFRLLWNKKMLGSGYSGYSGFVDAATYIGCIQAAFEHPANVDFAHYDKGTYA